MTRIRNLAYTALVELLDPVGQIVLAQSKGIPEVLVPGYAALCQRKQPLNALEVSKLGPSVTALVGKEREENQRRISESLGCTMPTPVSPHDAIVRIGHGGKGFGPEGCGLYFQICEKGTDRRLLPCGFSTVDGIQLQLWPGGESLEAMLPQVFISRPWQLGFEFT